MYLTRPSASHETICSLSRSGAPKASAIFWRSVGSEQSSLVAAVVRSSGGPLAVAVGLGVGLDAVVGVGLGVALGVALAAGARRAFDSARLCDVELGLGLMSGSASGSRSSTRRAPASGWPARPGRG